MPGSSVRVSATSHPTVGADSPALSTRTDARERAQPLVRLHVSLAPHHLQTPRRYVVNPMNQPRLIR